jgi:DmsE family decaheme c-type cytochrome
MFGTNRSHSVLLLAFVLLLLTAATLLAANTKSQHGDAATSPGNASWKADYVGSETCKGCHEGIEKGLNATPHSELLDAEAKKAAHAGCEFCHGPGSAHVEGGGDKAKIISFKNLSPGQASAQCLTCHEKGREQQNYRRSAHQANGVGCTSCHSIHAAKERRGLLPAPSPTLCYQCHTEAKAEFSRPFRHRVNEGLVRCSDCHNVHGGFLEKQLKTTDAEEQACVKCHSEKKGPFVFEHMAVKTEGCSSCHTAHGSTTARLLKVSNVNQLCLQCHTLAKSSVPSQPPIGPAHNLNQKYQACTLCHPFVHGSNFSEVFFKP